MRGSSTRRAQCHPDRPHRALGLCEPCYETLRRRRAGIKPFVPAPEFASCHPERACHARGLCSTCYSAQYKPERKRQHLLRQYGLTEDLYSNLVAAQGGRCAICRTNTPGGTGRWHVDHDHETGEVRGLLCNRCNRAIGMLDDDPELLDAAAVYLRRHRAEAAA